MSRYSDTIAKKCCICLMVARCSKKLDGRVHMQCFISVFNVCLMQESFLLVATFHSTLSGMTIDLWKFWLEITFASNFPLCLVLLLKLNIFQKQPLKENFEYYVGLNICCSVWFNYFWWWFGNVNIILVLP